MYQTFESLKTAFNSGQILLEIQNKQLSLLSGNVTAIEILWIKLVTELNDNGQQSTDGLLQMAMYTSRSTNIVSNVTR